MHYKSFFKQIVIITICMGIMLYGCSKERGTKIVVKGSTTVLPITQKVAEEYRKIKKVSISIEGSGSGNGIKALIDGSCEIANSSREMKEKEIAKAKAKNIKLKEITIAYDMIVPIVHLSNPVSNVSLDQLKAIYTGFITDWKELGANEEKIVVISRDTSSGTYEVWNKIVMKKAEVMKNALLQASNGAIQSVVSTNKKAIGYVGFAYVNNNIKPLTVNGVVGTIKNGKSGKFPISRKLYIYINENTLSKEAKDFVNFIMSDKGQKLIAEIGFIPVKSL